MRTSRTRRVAIAFTAVLVAALAVVAPSSPAAADPPPSATITPTFHQTAAGAPGSHVAVASWQVQSSAVAQQSGALISQPTYRPADWYVAPARSTVMAALLANGAFGKTDLFFSNNLATAVDPEMFQVPWWYRTTFTVPADSGRTVLRSFGIIPGADVWVNGHQVATRTNDRRRLRHERHRHHHRRPRGHQRRGVRHPPTNPNQDFTLGWVDWNQTPPDNNMGIWRDVQIVRTGDVMASAPAVSTSFPAANLAVADLTVAETVSNRTAAARSVVVTVKLSGHGSPITVSQRVTVAADASRTLTFRSPAFPALTVRHPAVWWPIGQGAHPLYTAYGDRCDRRGPRRSGQVDLRYPDGHQQHPPGRRSPVRGERANGADPRRRVGPGHVPA